MMHVNCDFIDRYIALKMLENIHADLGRSALPSRTHFDNRYSTISSNDIFRSTLRSSRYLEDRRSTKD